jgi:hypothetical protein
MRLDSDLWRPDSIGVVGPPHLLTGVLSESKILYRPLHAHYENGLLEDAFDDPFVVILPDRGAVTSAVKQELPLTSHHEDDVVGVRLSADGREPSGFIVAERMPEDERVARIAWLAWPDTGGIRPVAEEVLLSGSSTLLRILAERGVVGLIGYAWDGETYTTFNRLLGFETASAVARGLGYGEVDTRRPLAQWSANIEGDYVTHFHVVMGNGRAATAEQVGDAQGALRQLYGRRQFHPSMGGADIRALEPSEPSTRMRVRGDIVLGGANGWGTGREVEDDVVEVTPGDWMRRVPVLLAAWLRD